MGSTCLPSRGAPDLCDSHRYYGRASRPACRSSGTSLPPVSGRLDYVLGCECSWTRHTMEIRGADMTVEIDDPRFSCHIKGRLCKGATGDSTAAGKTAIRYTADCNATSSTSPSARLSRETDRQHPISFTRRPLTATASTSEARSRISAAEHDKGPYFRWTASTSFASAASEASEPVWPRTSAPATSATPLSTKCCWVVSIRISSCSSPPGPAAGQALSALRPSLAAGGDRCTLPSGSTAVHVSIRTSATALLTAGPSTGRLLSPTAVRQSPAGMATAATPGPSTTEAQTATSSRYHGRAAVPRHPQLLQRTRTPDPTKSREGRPPPPTSPDPARNAHPLPGAQRVLPPRLASPTHSHALFT